MGAAAEQAKLMLFARQGFTPELAAAAETNPDVVLVDLNRLYRGSLSGVAD